MPYYDYKHIACGYTKELLTKGEQEKKGMWCDGCGNGNVAFEKQLSAPLGFKLIGSGFYKAAARGND